MRCSRGKLRDQLRDKLLACAEVPEAKQHMDLVMQAISLDFGSKLFIADKERSLSLGVNFDLDTVAAAL